MSNSSILALFGPKSTPAPTATQAHAQNFNSSSMFGSLPTQQPPQQQFGGLGGLQMTSFGAAPQQQQQQFGGFPQQHQVAQTQQQQFGQFQAVNPPQQQNFGVGLISQPPAVNAASSSQQNSKWHKKISFKCFFREGFKKKVGNFSNHILVIILLFIALFSLITNSWIQGIRFIINSLSPPNFHNFCRPLLYKYSIEILQTIWETFLVHHKIGSSFT